MKRYQRDFVVSAVAFALFALMTATGVLMRFILPKGSGESLAVWGLGRHDWGAVHFWMAAGLVATIAVHVFVNRRWIVAVVRGRPGPARSRRRFAYGGAAVVLVLAAALAPLLSPVRQSGSPAEHEMEAGVLPPPPLGAPAGPGKSAPAAPRVLAVDSSGCAPVQESGIHGTMSLGDVARTSGVPVDHLLRELHLPADVSRDRPLRELTGAHGFTMDDVRRVVTDYLKHCE